MSEFTVQLGGLFAVASGFLLLSDLVLERVCADEAPKPSSFIVARTFSFASVCGFYGSGLLFLIVLLVDSGGGPANEGSSAFKLLAQVGVLLGLVLMTIGRSLIARLARFNVERAVGSSRRALQSERIPEYFIAMEYYALMLNRTYKVFVTDRALCGAKVRGLVASPVVPSNQMQDPAYWGQSALARVYDRVDVTSPSFLKFDWSNFQIPWDSVVGVDFDPTEKWGMGSVPHTGKILMRMRGGKTREFILLGRQDGQLVRDRLRDAIAAA